MHFLLDANMPRRAATRLCSLSSMASIQIAQIRPKNSCRLNGDFQADSFGNRKQSRKKRIAAAG
jgi:hypothetical protein